MRPVGPLIFWTSLNFLGFLVAAAYNIQKLERQILNHLRFCRPRRGESDCNRVPHFLTPSGRRVKGRSMNNRFEKLNNIPPALRAGNLFAGWCTRYDGKRQSKIPVNVQTGRYAHADRPGDWCDFQTTVGALSDSALEPSIPSSPHAAHPLAVLAGCPTTGTTGSSKSMSTMSSKTGN